MEQAQQAELDQQVAEVMRALEAAGEPASVESVARRVKRRTADVLESLKRLTFGTPGPDADADTPPEHYPGVQTAAAKVAQLTEAVAAAEVDVTAAEQAYAEAEAQAAEALIDGREPISLMEAQQAVLAAAESVHLLEVAQTVAKARHAEALAQAQAQHWQALWRAYQRDIAVFDAALAEAYDAQQAVLASWNRCGQPNEAPVLKAPLAVWKTDFHQWLMTIVATAPEEVTRGVSGSGGQPHAY